MFLKSLKTLAFPAAKDNPEDNPLLYDDRNGG
jgi:hypothetical protein